MEPSKDCETSCQTITDSSQEILHQNAPETSSSGILRRLYLRIKAKTDKLSKRQVIILSLLAFVDLLAATIISIQAPFFPEVASSKGASAAEYGLVFGIFELTAIISSPIFGSKMKVLGPINVFIGGILVTGICSIVFGFLDKIEDSTTFIVSCTVVRVLEAVGDSAYATASYTIVTMEFPDSVATTFSIFETCYGLGMIAGPLIGGLLYDVGGYKLPFLAMGGTLFISAIVAILVLPKKTSKEASADEETRSEVKSKGIWNFIRIPVIWMTSFGIVTAATGVGFLSALIEPHLREFGLSKTSLGAVIILSGGVYAITAPFWGWMCDSKRVEPKLLVLGGSIFSIIGFSLIGPLPFVPLNTTIWMTCIGLSIFGLGLGSIFVSGFIIYLQDSIKRGFGDDVSTYGLVSGFWTSMVALGYGLGPTIGGLLEDNIGFRWGSLFVIGSNALLALWITTHLLISRISSKPQQSNEKSKSDIATNL